MANASFIGGCVSGVEVLLGLYEKGRSFRDNGCFDAWVFLAPTREVVGEAGREAGGERRDGVGGR